MDYLSEISFELDPLLKKDSVFIKEFPLCKLLLMNDSNFPWFLMIPRREGAVEVFDLNKEDQNQLNKESNYVLKKLKEHFKATKMNVANLGNIVSQLHIHHIARFEGDLAWPGPIWGVVPSKPYSEEEIETIVDEVRTVLATF